MSWTLLKDPQLICLLFAQVVPFLIQAEMNLDVLNDMVWEDLIRGNQVTIDIDGCGVTDRKWPVMEWAAEGFPDAGRNF